MEIVDGENIALGFYQPGRERARLPGLPTDLQPRYGRVVMNGNLLIELNSNLLTDREMNQHKIEGLAAPPLVANPPKSMSFEQKYWLLALIGYEISLAVRRASDTLNK